jgi:hypothetical protein
MRPPKNGIKAKVCSAIPSGRTQGVSGGIGGIGRVGGGAEVVVNYNSGQTSAFAFGGLQLGWNGGVSGSVDSGFVYGLNSSNSNYSGGFTGVNGDAAGLSPTGGVRAAGLSLGAVLLGGFSGGVSATNYTNPLQRGKFAAFTPVDFLLYAVRQVCD